MINFNTHFKQFEMIVEQFEVCKDLLKERSIHKDRFCIILLDNIAEILILRFLLDKFDFFDELRWIIEPDLSIKDRDQFLRFFNSKIKLIKKLKIIEDVDLDIIKICHNYRNLAFHNETYNGSTITLMSRLLFSSTLSLFEASQDSISEFWNKKVKWLSKYSLDTKSIYYINASKKIVQKIGLKRKPSIAYVKKILFSDLISRIDKINIIILDLYGNISKDKINIALKYWEFELFKQDIIEVISKEYREIRYTAGKGNVGSLLKKRYKIVENEYFKSYQIEFDKYSQVITMNRINNSKETNW